MCVLAISSAKWAGLELLVGWVAQAFCFLGYCVWFVVLECLGKFWGGSA